MLAIAVCQSTSLLNVPPSSRASFAPTGVGGDHFPGEHSEQKCGSGLARESSLSFNISVECAAVFASKPAPTLDSRCC
ncbi:hypothetical protein CES87_31120 [Pseudomonas sp. ERMR1:02]|nr:hypothetical protein CES87_31120 [Pseudomonas sp. ERMR1:02]